MDPQDTAFLMMTFVALGFYLLWWREHRTRARTEEYCTSYAKEVAKLSNALSERSEQYWRDQQQLDQNRQYITKMQNECEQRDNTIAQLQSQVATLQSAQRIRDSNRGI